MAKRDLQSVAIPEALHSASAAALQPFGLSVADFVGLVLHQLVEHGRAPSEFLMPNEETQSAMLEETQPIAMTQLSEMFYGRSTEEPARAPVKQTV